MRRLHRCQPDLILMACAILLNSVESKKGKKEINKYLQDPGGGNGAGGAEKRQKKTTRKMKTKLN